MRATALALVATLVACGVTGTAVGRAQTSKGTGPGGGGAFDRLREDTTRPVPQVPPPAPRPPRSDMIWVPDRHVPVPGEGTVYVPGHWERRISEHETYAPPLTGHTGDGRSIQLPPGPRRLDE